MNVEVPTFDYPVRKTWTTCGCRQVLAVDFQGREYEVWMDDPRVLAFVLTYRGDPGMVRLNEPIYEFPLLEDGHAPV